MDKNFDFDLQLFAESGGDDADSGSNGGKGTGEGKPSFANIKNKKEADYDDRRAENASRIGG